MISKGTILSGRYEVLDKIGSGGMAIVFRGKDQTLDRYVTIKVLRDEFVGDQEFIDRFKSEARSAARLSHPNIVRVYDVGEESGNYFIVMEYIHGDTLKKAIEEKAPFDANTTINVAIQIAAALSQAHKNHIVHRDIKPQNILVGTDGIIKVTDFGIARAATSATMSMSTNAAGSVHYFSPEQARGGYVDEKSDIYSLGISMYEMITGKLPFQGDNSVAIAMKHITEELPDIRMFNAKASKSIEGIIKMATRKKVDERYPSIDMMLEDLMRAKMENSGPNMLEEDVPGASAAVAATIAASVPRNLSREDDKNKELSYIVGGPRRARQLAKEGSLLTGKPVAGTSADSSAIEGVRGSRGEGLPASGVGFDKYSKKLKISNDDDYEKEYEEVEPLKRSQAPQKMGMPKRSPRKDADYNNEYDKKKERTVIFAAVCTALVIIAVISAFGFRMLAGGGLFGGKNEANIEVPDFEGVDFDKAEEAAKALGFTLLKEGQDFSKKHAVGVVISQSTAVGTKVAAEAQVGVTVSLGLSTESEIMPNLIGKSKADAEKAINNLVGVNPDIVYESDTKETVGKVIAQTPDNGGKVNSKSKILLTVSRGEESSTIAVPKLEGLSESQAKRELERGGLKLGNVTKAESETVAEGVVITQTVTAGTEVASDSVVGIVISSGPAVVEPPKEETPETPTPQPTPQPTPPAATSATKVFSIDAPSTAGDSVHVKLVTVGADGTTTTIIDEVRTIDTFPYVTSITGTGSATVQCYIDGVQQWSENTVFTEG